MTGAGSSDPGSECDLVVVANRLPVRHDGATGAWTTSPGGLVSAMRPVLDRTRGRWIGWNDGPTEPPPVPGLQLESVTLRASVVEGHYHGYANRTLWPAMHGMVERIEEHPGWWAAYQEANDRFARAVVATAPRGACVWVHDYHLLLTPAMIRAIRPDLTVGLFLHTPVPAPAVLRSLRGGNGLRLGLTGATMIGTQRSVDADNLRAFLGETSTRVAVHPISIDTDRVHDAVADPLVTALSERIRARLAGGRRILLGVDRLDYTKGIPERLRAFDQLMALGLLDPDEVVLIQVASPTRTAIPAYRALTAEVRALVATINGTHLGRRGPVVRLITDTLSFREVCAHYLAADVALVTPLRDGMNLVSKEFVTARAGDPAALVLSSGAGAADELRDGAVMVDATSPLGLAAGIHQAVLLDGDIRRARTASAAEHVARHDVHRWAAGFLADLRSSTPAS